MRLRSIVRKFLLLLAGACLAAPAVAQLYKNVMPDGRVIYTDQPMKGAKETHAIEMPPPPSPAERAAAEKRAEKERLERSALEQRIADRQKALDTADARVAKARKALADAKAALAAGRAPEAGEMRANVGGGARPGPDYFKRVDELKRNVDAAQKELDAALRARNEAR